MDYAAVRRLFLKIFLGFLGLTAVIAILSVLSGEFGELQGKILATCFTISASSICAMSCAAFIEKKRHVVLGLSGILLAILSGILVIIGMWPEIDSEAYWKSTATLAVAAIGLAYAFLFLLPELDPSHGWLQRVFSLSVGVLALQIVVAIWGEIDAEGYYRALAVVAILVGLQTLAIPIMTRLRKGTRAVGETLLLERVGGEIYRDSTGRTYQLKEVHSEPQGQEASDSNHSHREREQ